MGTIALPNNPGTIQNTQVTDATKVMENFTAIVNEVNGNIEPVNIKALAVETAKIAALAVTAAKLATDAVETLKIKDANVTEAKLAVDSVVTAKIKNANVTEAKLGVGAVTVGKLASDAVETIKIKNLNVTAAKLAADAVETLKIKDANVTTAKIANENVTLAKIARSTLDTYLKAQGAADPIFEKLALRDTGIKIGSNAVVASGDKAHTDLGFQPSVVIFLFHATAIDTWSVGFDDGTVAYSIYRDANANVTSYDVTYSLHVHTDNSNKLEGNITALSGSGFTITFVETGTVAGRYMYLALP